VQKLLKSVYICGNYCKIITGVFVGTLRSMHVTNVYCSRSYLTFFFCLFQKIFWLFGFAEVVQKQTVD